MSDIFLTQIYDAKITTNTHKKRKQSRLLQFYRRSELPHATHERMRVSWAQGARVYASVHVR